MSARVMAIVRDRNFGGDPALTAVLVRLAEEVDDDGAGAIPDMEMLAADLEVKIGTIQRALRQARDAGLVSVIPEPGGLYLRLHVAELLAVPLTEAGRRRFASPGGPHGC